MYFLTLSFKKNDPKFEKTWDHRIPVWNGSKSNKRCDRLNIFKTITVQKNPIVLTGCKRFSDITFLSSQISTFGMVIVCTGTDHRRPSVEIFVELSFQCRSASKCIHALEVVFKLVHAL